MTDERTPVDAAIDAAAEKAREPRSPITVEILDHGDRWTGSQAITINAPPESKGNQPTLLMYDEKQLAWRAVLLPPGSSWRVVPDHSGVWTPPNAGART
jgi:hypothetical protein